MHYYPHHIGDFISDTSRLSDSQCMAYLRLIWIYYDTEKPLENDPDSLAFKIGASSSDVLLILKHYFFLDGDVWRNTRCEKVLDEYHGKADKARKSAEIRWKNAKAKQSQSNRNANASGYDANESKIDANQEPITNNQEPNNNLLAPESAPRPKAAKKQKSDLDYSVWPEQPSEQILNDWITLRTSKRAKVTQTVLNTLATEFEKAARFGFTVDQCLSAIITSGWTGFKFEWLQNQLARGSPNAGFKQPDSFGRGQAPIGHADRVRAQAQRAIQRIDAQAGNSVVYQDGGFVR